MFILLFYIRSFDIQNIDIIKKLKIFNNNLNSTASSGQNDDVCGNKNVQIYCLQILTKLIQELIYICQNTHTNILLFDDVSQFSQYVYEILERCKVQKTLLHCLFSTTTTTTTTTTNTNSKDKTLTKIIINENLKNISQQTQYAFICELINCIQNLINLEYVLSLTVQNTKVTSSLKGATYQQQVNNDNNDDYLITKSALSEMKFLQSTQTSSQTTRYIQYLPIISQSMFISSVLYYLRHLSLFEFHLPILNLIRNSLPFTGNSLKSWSAFIIEQLSSNLMQIVSLYELKPPNNSNNNNNASNSLPYNHNHTYFKQYQQINSLANINIPDFFVLIIKQLSCLLHFSLLISNNTVNSINLSKSVNNNGTTENELANDFQNDAILIKSHKQSIIDFDNCQIQAKDSLINHLPSILSRMTNIWKAMNQSEIFGNEHSAWFLGNPKAIKNHITDMLAPIAANHGVSFTIAIGQVWGEKKKKSKAVIEHKVLIEVIKSLKSSFSISYLLQNIAEIIKNSNTILKDKKKSILNLWLLQFLHVFNESIKSHETEYYTQLCAFFKECIYTTHLLPSVYFQLFRILHDSVSVHSALVDDKKYSKDIQESTHKLVDLCNNYVASSLQQTTWLRKNYSVKLSNTTQNGKTNNGSNNEEVINDDNHQIDVDENINNFSDNGVNDDDINDSNNNIIHSYQALNILAEYLAKTLDIAYKSEEKERLVVPVLYNVMNNIWPYLKTHLYANKNNFKAASQLLMNLTGYPYTRKTWKKEVFEMLFDSSFFYVDSITLNHWKVIIDNLISNDRTMFKDVIVRVTYPQSSGLFTSREHEAELKSQLLKRLGFVIFASEKDQYQKNMPEIQECIAQVLKVVQSANLYSTLFLLFRVLLLRVSSRHLIALWPSILSELILILLQIEQDLFEELDNNKSIKPSILETLTYPSVNLSNLIQSNTVKLNVYLSACKLIDLILTLPCSLTSQFQLYKWSFVNINNNEFNSCREQFMPYLVRIENLFKYKYPNHKTGQIKQLIGSPIIKQKQIQTLVELKAFFDTVTSQLFINNVLTNLSNPNQLKLYEQTVHDDFNEGWTT